MESVVRRAGFKACLIVVAAVVIIGIQLASVSGQVIGGPGGNREYPPRITEHPQSVIVPKETPTTLGCRADGRPEPDIAWLKNGEPLDLLSRNDHRSKLADGLFFLRVIPSKGNNPDVGTYQCVATNWLGQAYSNNATLEVTYIRNDFRLHPSPTEAVAGEPIVLECQPPRGYPEPTVSWSKDDEEVMTDGDRVKVLQDGNLMISQSRGTDTGNYVCTATNLMGSRSTQPVRLTVKAAPTFLVPLQDSIVAPSDAVVLKCQVVGDPEPTVTWTKGGVELTQGRFNVQEDNSLRIRLIAQDDEGVYVCTAGNSYGQVTDDLLLTVSVIPTFTKAPVDRTVEPNQVAAFQCQATGSPLPAIYWRKEGSQEELLFIGMESGRYQVTPEGDLRIRDVREEDEGYYICAAHSGSSQAEARAFLRVIASASQPPPIIRYGPSDQTLIVGTVALLTCEAAGDPEPTVRWTKDGAPLQPNLRFTVLDTGPLQISGSQADDSGNYSCIATNNSGQTSWTASLRVIERWEASDIPVLQAPNIHELPAAPGQPTGRNITRTSLSLTWLPPSQGNAPLSPVTQYRVEYFSYEVASEWRILPSHCSSETCLIQQLRPGTTYLFLVRAVNDRGIGPPSSISQPITTRDDMSPIPSDQTTVIEEKLSEASVDITNVLVLSQTAIKVLWEVRQHREFIEGYRLKYRADTGTNGFTMQTVLGSTSKIITELLPDTGYSITVQPFSSGFNGPESDQVDIRTLSQGDELQDPPQDNSVLQGKLDTCGASIVGVTVITSTSLKLTWRVAKNEPYIDGYHIKHRGEIGDTVIQTVIGSTSKTLSGLQPWTWYTLTVQPFNGVYLGPESSPEVVRTASGVPQEAPLNVRVVNNGTSALLVTWQSPPAGSVAGVLAGYRVLCLGNSSSQHRRLTTDRETRSVRVTGLSAGKVYVVTVEPFTAAGAGPLSVQQSIYVAPAGALAGPIDGDDGSSVPVENDSVVTEPWFIASLAGFFLLILLGISVFVWRRHAQYKLGGSINKGPISRDNAAASHNIASLPGSNQFPPSNHSSAQGSLQHGQGWVNPSQRPLPSTAGLLGDTPDHHDPEGGTLRQYDAQQMGTDGHPQHHYQANHSCYGSGGPVYAVVDNEDEEDDEVNDDPAVHGLHSARTLPLSKCPEHLVKEKLVATSSLPSHVTEPYASTTLIMAGKDYDCRPPCSHSGSSEQSGCSSHSGVRAPVRGHRPDNGMHSSSGGSSQGDRENRKKSRHRGSSKQQPARNWTELLPPPPEQPPTDIDSPTGNALPPPPPPQFPHATADTGRMHKDRKRAPTPPTRQPTAPVLPVPAGSYRPQPTNSFPGRNGSHELPDRPSGEAVVGYPGGPCLATKRVFEDPRHEQLGKELLGFNDDMSQSEMLSDNEDAVGMPITAATSALPGVPHNHGTYNYAPPTGGGHMTQPGDDTDQESAAMLGSWSSMNGGGGGSTSSDRRHSSDSSEGSFFTDADFASAVAAAAQSSGMHVVGSKVTGPRTGNNRKHGRSGGDRRDKTTHAAHQGLKPERSDNPARMTTFRPAPTSSLPRADQPNNNHLVLQQDSSSSGLTVTANPLAFAMEHAEV